MNWTIEKVVRQAVVLYEGQREEAMGLGDLQGEQFWESHRNTALYALRGVDTPVSLEEVAAFIERWNNEPDDEPAGLPNGPVAADAPREGT